MLNLKTNAAVHAACGGLDDQEGRAFLTADYMGVELVRNQAGKPRDDPALSDLRRELRLLEDSAEHEQLTLSKQEMLDLLVRHGTFEMIMGDIAGIGSAPPPAPARVELS